MAQSRTRFIGMAVHKDPMAGASVAQEHGAAVIYLGTLGTRQGDSDHLVRKMPSTATHLIFVDAAGPGGSWLSRSLTNKGSDCWGVAPARIPNKAGDRVTTDRRDAGPLARLARAGDRPVVSVPTVADEAIRALTRAREEALSEGKDATFRRHAFVRRPAIRSPGRAHGGPAPLRWLSEVVCPTPAQHIVCQAYVRAVTEHAERLPRLAPERHEHVHAWRVPAVVDALQALRGVPCTVAVTLVADLGDLTRFDPPRALRQCLGLIPSASASGERRQQGAITQAGHTHARRALGAGAWASRSPAKVSRPLQLRRAKQPTMRQDIGWQAHGRLCQRSRHLVARGNQAPSVPVAMARERAGGMGAMAPQLPVAA